MCLAHWLPPYAPWGQTSSKLVNLDYCIILYMYMAGDFRDSGPSFAVFAASHENLNLPNQLIILLSLIGQIIIRLSMMLATLIVNPDWNFIFLQLQNWRVFLLDLRLGLDHSWTRTLYPLHLTAMSDSESITDNIVSRNVHNNSRVIVPLDKLN